MALNGIQETRKLGGPLPAQLTGTTPNQSNGLAEGLDKNSVLKIANKII